MEPFKNIYQKKSLTDLADAIHSVDSKFDKKAFLDYALTGLSKLELKERVNQVADALHRSLPYNYPKNTKVLIKTLAPYNEHIDHEWESSLDGISGFMVWPYCTYVEKYGLDDLEASINAMLEFTQRFSSEFVIRHFIKLHEKKMFTQLKIWKKHPNHHVRRLVSEGTRPRLPWGISVDCLKTNLKRNISLIYSLRKDPSLYVRRSVANHLNDISHIDTGLFFETLEKMGDTVEEQYVKRHASRTLLKKAHPRALALHGYKKLDKAKASLDLKTQKIKEGENLIFNVSLTLPKESKILLEYIIHYKKANGSYSEKVFRLRDKEGVKELDFLKKVSFKKVTTRVHYEGEHFIQLQLNGKRFPKQKFYLEV